MSTVALTKKQQKAQAFRSKQKAKKSGRALPEDVPESDIPDEDIGEDGGVIAEASSSKKRKRGDAEAGDGEGKEGKPEDLTGGAKGKAKSIGKGKGKWEEDGEEDGKATKKSKKEIKQRFILFIGNIGFKTTIPDVQQHFKEALGITPQVRLLTTKPTRAGQAPKSRGIAFLEVPTSENMQAALKLHHTTLNSRRINVELTAGGGGKSDSRVGKIKERNERVDVQRVKRAEKEAAEGVESGAAAGAVGMGDERRQRQRPQRVWGAGAVEAAPAAPAQAQVQRDVAPAVAAPAEAPVQRAPKVQEDASFVQGVNDGTVKVRGGRRVKVAPNAKGGNNRQGARPPPRPRWEPTGANAMSVG